MLTHLKICFGGPNHKKFIVGRRAVAPMAKHNPKPYFNPLPNILPPPPDDYFTRANRARLLYAFGRNVGVIPPRWFRWKYRIRFWRLSVLIWIKATELALLGALVNTINKIRKVKGKIQLAIEQLNHRAANGDLEALRCKISLMTDLGLNRIRHYNEVRKQLATVEIDIPAIDDADMKTKPADLAMRANHVRMLETMEKVLVQTDTGPGGDRD